MIQFTQGDSAILNLTAVDGSGNPIDITGATFTTQIKGPNNTLATFANGQHTIVSGPAGTFRLALSTTDTLKCGTGTSKAIVTKIVSGPLGTVYFRGTQILTVFAPQPQQ